MKLLLIFIALLNIVEHSKCNAAEARSDSFGSLSLGHNLTSNNRTLRKNQWSLGSLYFGYGITDRWTVATSFFVFNSFEIVNLITRYSFLISKKEKLGFGLSYFKSMGKRIQFRQSCFNTLSEGRQICKRAYSYYSGFVMEAAALSLTYSREIASYYRFNTSLSYFYYYDDRLPFSFRMDPRNSDPYSLSLTTLNEFRVADSLYINFEAGMWGINYHYSYFHSGLSLNLQNESGLIGVGLSATFSPSFPKHLVKTFPGYDSRFALHPEIQLQLFF